jgi:membrane-bound inhibitor of C-type lysozyme
MNLFAFKPRFLAPPVVALLLAGCVLPPQHTYDYACLDGYEFSIRYSGAEDPGDVALLEEESGTSKLPRAPSASGARYSNGITTFWATGDTAMILYGDEVVRVDCTR